MSIEQARSGEPARWTSLCWVTKPSTSRPRNSLVTPRLAPSYASRRPPILGRPPNWEKVDGQARAAVRRVLRAQRGSARDGGRAHLAAVVAERQEAQPGYGQCGDRSVATTVHVAWASRGHGEDSRRSRTPPCSGRAERDRGRASARRRPGRQVPSDVRAAVRRRAADLRVARAEGRRPRQPPHDHPRSTIMSYTRVATRRG